MQYVVKAQNLDDLDDFTRAYLEAAEWSGLDEDDDAALELAVDPTWDAASIERAAADCTAFRAAAADLLDGIDAGQAGHDFWLTRNRHGAGFWDRGLGAVGDALTVAAHGYGETGVWFDADTETLSLDGTYTDLPAGAGDTVIHVPEDPDGIVLQESLHLTAKEADDDDADWCETCEAVTRYEGEVCHCCGRRWGYEGGTCRQNG